MHVRKLGHVTNAELAVYAELLKRGSPSTTGELRDSLYLGEGQSKYSTVQKLLDRLSAEGIVAKDKSHWPHKWKAVNPDEAYRRLMGNFTYELAIRIFKDKEVAARYSGAVEGSIATLFEIAKNPELLLEMLKE